MELGADLEDPGSLCGGCPGRTAEAEVSASWSGLMGWQARLEEARVSKDILCRSALWASWSWSGCKLGNPWTFHVEDTLQDSGSGNGYKPGCLRAFHSEGALVGQLKVEWVQAGGSLGMLHRGCPCGVVGSRAGGCLCYLQGAFWWDSWCQSRHQPGGPRALCTGGVLASCLKQMWCRSGVFRDPAHLCHCDATGGAVVNTIHGVLVYTFLNPPWWDC